MARRLTKEAINRLLAKGLTGWEAGKLILQDMVDDYLYRESFLTEADIDTIRSTPMQGADIRDYNMFIALGVGFHFGHILGEWACVDAGLHIAYLDGIFRDASKRRTVELFESSGPRIVTRKQYEDIITAQTQKKLAFEYSLGYVIEERFYAIAPPETRDEIDEICPDVECTEDFASAVPEKYKSVLKQAVDEIRSLYTSGKLPTAFHKEDAKEAEPLLAKWKAGRLSEKETVKLMDMLFVTGERLYDCEELPEWKDYANKYHQYMFADEDGRFKHVYAVLEDYTGVWVDENGYYDGPPKASEFVARDSEYLLGLIDHDDKPKKSIKTVATELRDRLDTAEQNIRMVLAVKAILDAAAEAVGLSIPSEGGMLALPYMRIGAFIGMYNLRLGALKEKRLPWESGETKLDKALKTLPAIDPEKLKPSPDSLKQLKDNVLKHAQGHNWLQTKMRSLKYDDGFDFSQSRV
jgi:hypothetical protein